MIECQADLLQWCVPSYSELTSEWIHLKGLRVYIESILRYGLHTTTFSFIVFVGFCFDYSNSQPTAKTASKLLDVLKR